MKQMISIIAIALLSTATAQNGTPRKYDASGVIYLEDVYHVNMTKNKPLRALGYTEAMLPDSFPAFTEYWRMHGWPRAEMLDLYLFECAWNDVVYGTDGYYGKGFYIRGNFVSQSRAEIIAPGGKYNLRFGCLTAIGTYTGAHAQISSDATGTLLGGTALEIDHLGWSPRQPYRVCLLPTVWGLDYGVVGGIAYQEGIVVQQFRFMGAKGSAGAFTGFSTGCALNEPGENSLLRLCMAEDFKGAGYTIYNGTPGSIEICSAFVNDGPGFDLVGSNGLCNVRITTPSGDDNRGGLIRIRPMNAQSVGGGTITITGLKSESRTAMQVPILIEGAMGDLNMTVNGLTANYIGQTCPYLIGGNWTGNQFEINANGIDLRDNTQALFRHGGKGWTLTGGKAYSGNSFIVNDEGLAFRSRSNMVLQGGPTTGPGPVEPPPTGGTLVAKASHTGTEGGVLREAKYIVDANAGTFWISGRSMTATGDQWIQVDYGTIASRSAVSFDIANGYVNSHPRTFDVQVSTDGNAWTTVKSGVAGAYPTCSATFNAVSCRYIRVVCKSANSNWWAVAAWR